ncbi:small redox-active disulfide protein 2 [Natronincola peptidivorans]|uniref:Small redox-active disulfide protein 2 n=1 Tax=Natronincola peptidivorans TaxID=426128 RepID=A0A1I0G155_9FIRM|nr:thioredoxin family protein [Natronincola peptidivorans]SET63703.1 small redox-active disulfide protein 2 [Natronincola peptidivorans]
MNIKVLGSGCKNCTTVEKNVKEALQQLNLQGDVEKVTDFKSIAEYGVMKTPGLVVNDKVVASGKVPTVDEIKSLLAK